MPEVQRDLIPSLSKPPVPKLGPGEENNGVLRPCMRGKPKIIEPQDSPGFCFGVWSSRDIFTRGHRKVSTELKAIGTTVVILVWAAISQHHG